MMIKKDVVEIMAENIFNDPNFQKKWQQYLVLFGNDIEKLFDNSYKAKVHFAAVLQKICDKNYKEAVSDLKAYHSSCISEYEKNIFSRLIDEYEKNISVKTYPPKSDRYMKYREILCSKGFSEAKQNSGHFFRQATEQTAFVINLDDEEFCITVLYGFASTSYMSGNEEWFSNNGSDNESCQVRNVLCISDERDELKASEVISAFYDTYKNYSKDEILALKKEKQKAFLDHFARALKPLGFKKKGTKWTKALGGNSALSFEAQKSAYSDQYYFNVSLHDISDFYARQSYERVVMHNSDIYNWQLMSEEQIHNLIQYTLHTYINPKIKT